ncbi:hypothetical protein OVA06_17675 [Pseudarthrobacter sp. SL88]|uniref:hypothetical protein n=1 Tax=Pseudarthrobacter sp. SL88 TaxID=2994666 RepID=UPI002276F230|nr:hypothetical protein [Pseudarthrobacter sp. SL88]MCY1676507.1 hypothetical protein [Pseudarthrobacter sp. SL88]
MASPQTIQHPSRLVLSRWEEATSEAGMRGHAGNRRLHECWISYLGHRKHPVIAIVAIARELSGCCWSLATGNLATRHAPTDFHWIQRNGNSRYATGEWLS